jgi:hypothetical protein
MIRIRSVVGPIVRVAVDVVRPIVVPIPDSPASAPPPAADIPHVLYKVCYVRGPGQARWCSNRHSLSYRRCERCNHGQGRGPRPRHDYSTHNKAPCLFFRAEGVQDLRDTCSGSGSPTSLNREHGKRRLQGVDLALHIFRRILGERVDCVKSTNWPPESLRF